MINPSMEETEKIGKVKFDGAKGIRPIVDWKGYKYYLGHPKMFIVDYGQSGWKVGFLKRAIGFRRIPYALFKLTYKLFKR